MTGARASRVRVASEFHRRSRRTWTERGKGERVDVVGLRLTRAMPHSDTSVVAAEPTTGLPHCADRVDLWKEGLRI